MGWGSVLTKTLDQDRGQDRGNRVRVSRPRPPGLGWVELFYVIGGFGWVQVLRSRFRSQVHCVLYPVHVVEDLEPTYVAAVA